MSKRPELTEGVVVDQQWLNQRHDALTVTLQTYNLQGTNVCDLRKFAMNRKGLLVPTAKGLSIAVVRLRDLAKAINKAVAKAFNAAAIASIASVAAAPVTGGASLAVGPAAAAALSGTGGLY